MNRHKKIIANKISYIKPADRMILILVFLMFLALIAAVNIGKQRYKGSQLTAAQDSMDILAGMQKTQLEQYISYKLSSLQALATLPDIYEMDAGQQADFIRGRSGAFGFHHIFVLQADGMGIYFEENTTRDQKDEPFFDNVMNHDVYITEPFYGGDAVTITISVSIRDEDGNKVGALCGAVNLKQIQQMFQENRMLMDGISYLINRDGAYIASLDMQKVYNKGIVYEETDSDSSLMEEAFANYSDITGTMVQDGVEYLVNITYLKDYDWVLVQGIPTEELFKGIRYIDYWSYAALAILAVIILCVTRIIFHWHHNNRRVNTDTLTGCKSRAAMQSLTEQLEPVGKYDITVIYFDLNHFKQVNDTYGHDCGDRILRIFAKVLMEVFDGKGQTGRMGGDEFMVVLLDTPEPEIQALCQQVDERLASQSLTLDFPYTISTSYGHATRRKDSRELLDDIITQADENMYRYKESHR